MNKVLEAGTPIEVKKGTKAIRIVPVKQGDKLLDLTKKPNLIKGNPDELADIHWNKEVNLDLP